MKSDLRDVYLSERRRPGYVIDMKPAVNHPWKKRRFSMMRGELPAAIMTNEVGIHIQPIEVRSGIVEPEHERPLDRQMRCCRLDAPTPRRSEFHVVE